MKMYRTVLVGIILLLNVLTTGCQSSSQTPDADAAAPAGAAVETTAVEKSVAATPAMPVAQNGGPAVTVEAASHDFGEMGPSAYGNCEFLFTSTGRETLKIERIQSTCGCAVPQLTKMEYEPGESGVVKVRFQAPSTKGPVKKHLYIISNDPENPRYELEIKASVSVQVSISPENVDLRLDQDNAGMGDIVVKSLDDREFSIQSVTVGRGVMTVPHDPSKKATEFVLKPTVDKQKLNELPTGAIQIKTDHPQSGALVVRYNAVPAYEVSRPRIILQNVEPGQSLTKDVIIRSNYATSVEIASATSRNGYMEIESQERDGEHLKLQVKITPPDRGETSRRYITDELSIVLTDQTTLTIRCSGWFKLD